MGIHSLECTIATRSTSLFLEAHAPRSPPSPWLLAPPALTPHHSTVSPPSSPLSLPPLPHRPTHHTPCSSLRVPLTQPVAHFHCGGRPRGGHSKRPRGAADGDVATTAARGGRGRGRRGGAEPCAKEGEEGAGEGPSPESEGAGGGKSTPEGRGGKEGGERGRGGTGESVDG